MKSNRISSRCLTLRSPLLFAFVLMMLALASCSTPYNVTYFQDMPLEKKVPIVKPQSIRLRPQDKISIMVSTRDASLSQLFSLYSTYSVSNAGSSSSTTTTKPSEYTIGADGTIEFPILGRLGVQGYTREELQNYIKDELVNRNLVKDPIVTVEYVNLNVTFMGAAGTVGRIPIDRDQFTILDAIAQAGDLALEGQRENVRVIRESGINQRVAYEVNLCSAEELYNSPVYYLQQNDIIYVEPNNKVKRTTTEYGSRMVNYTFWTGLLTSALTLFAIFK